MGLLGWSWAEVVWVASAVGVGLMGGLTLYAPDAAEFVADLTRYGVSASSKRSRLHRLIEVPKRWFVHFYVVAVGTSSVAFAAVWMAYVEGLSPSPTLKAAVAALGGREGRSSFSSSPASVWVATLLVFATSIRRLLETVFTLVYLESMMNVFHYAMGLVHYAVLPVAVLCRAPGFAPGVAVPNPELWALTWAEWLGVGLLVGGSWAQHGVFAQLAALRKSPVSGNVQTYAHGVVWEGLFRWVSCPHFLCECVIYAGLFLLLGPGHPSAGPLLAFVLTNQTLAALITHRWYRQRFGSLYPTDRKAIIPYLL